MWWPFAFFGRKTVALWHWMEYGPGYDPSKDDAQEEEVTQFKHPNAWNILDYRETPEKRNGQNAGKDDSA